MAITNDTGSVSREKERERFVARNDGYDEASDRGGHAATAAEGIARAVVSPVRREIARRGIRKCKNADREATAVVTFRTHGYPPTIMDARPSRARDPARDRLFALSEVQVSR